MNIADLNSDIENVFARFGEAVYEAQCLEKQLVILLSYISSPTPNKMSKPRYDELIETNLEQTFGSLANEIKNKIKISTDIQTKLDRAVEGRNWLSHNFWWDRASEFSNFQGRQGMLLELNELVELFSDLDLYFTDIVKKWAFQFGLTQNDFDESLVTFLSGPTPPRKNRHKLNKTEKLHNIYFYDTGNGTALLFELDDHSLVFV
jgi:hypothetical protein